MSSRKSQAAFLALSLVVAAVVFGLWTLNRWNSGTRPGPVPEAGLLLRHSTQEQPGSQRSSSEIDPSIVDYVGSIACRDCHAEIWEKYQSHPMSHSFSKVTTASHIEDYTDKTDFSPGGNRRYRVEKTADEVRHHEIMLDQLGEVVYDQSVPVQYAIGSGKRGRGYIVDHDGLLFQSSISWYSDRRAWGLSPEYPIEHHPRFERRMTGACLTCHTGLPNFERDEADRFAAPRFLEESIGCERCHGPGRKHVAARETGNIAGDPIVNPGHLDVDRREAVCAQCHLRGENRILRTGRTPHDFRPGERLEDNWIIFVKSGGTGVRRSGRVASQVEQMASSVCFVRSEGKMGCISCHDPHSNPSPAEKETYFRQRCLHCHEDRGCSFPLTNREVAPYFDNCMKCHMPSVNSTNALHRSIADHRILRRPSSDKAAEPTESNVFQFVEASIPQPELNRALAFKMIEDAFGPPARPELAEAAKQLLIPLIAESPNDVEMYVAMGNICQIQNQPREAVRWLSRVMELNPRHEKTVQNLATIFHDQYQLVAAERYLKRFIELNPWHGSYYGRLASTLMVRGDLKGAMAAAERGLELNPTLWELHEFLANAYAKTGDRESSERHRALLLRKHPPESKADR